MGIIDEAYKVEYQLSNQWDLVFPDPAFSSKNLHLKIVDASIPFYKLEVESKLTGEKFYKSLADLGTISLTVRESIDFNTHTYFQDWFNNVYDLSKRVFKKVPDEYYTFRDLKVVFYRPLLTALDTAFTIGAPLFQSFTTPSINPVRPSFEISLKRCRVLGVSDLSLSYSSGDPLTYSIELQPEEITYEKKAI